jgi:predicted TIM-barrel fold metal-dependent hydrolase
MSARLDAHAHFFAPGYVAQLPENCRRRTPDEITLYTALAQQHEIGQVLAVGYEGDPWAVGNNAYLADLTAQVAWVRPVAFVNDPRQLTVAQLDQWGAQRFVGISLYLFTPAAVAALAGVPNEVWRWLADRAWLLSVNSSGDAWRGWQPILQRFPEVHLLIAHLGLPRVVPHAPTAAAVRAELAPVLDLASHPHVYVKFSGFYALAEPTYDYPHRAAWPYAEAISATYGPAAPRSNMLVFHKPSPSSRRCPGWRRQIAPPSSTTTSPVCSPT